MKIIVGDSLDFVANGKDIAAAFTKITAVTTYVKADDTKFLIATVTKEDSKKQHGIYLIGTSTDALACMKLKGEAKKSGTLRVDAATLSGLLKSRGEMQFKSGTGKLIFKENKGNFKASLDVQEFDEEDVRMLTFQLTGRSGSEPIKKEIVEKLIDSVRKVHLQDFYEKSELPVIFSIGEKSMQVYCFDNFHVAHYKVKIKGGQKTRMALPAKAFSVIDKFTGTENISFTTADGRFLATGDGFIVSIPETQLSDGEYTMVLDYLKALDDMKPLTTLSFDTSSTKTVGNMAVLCEQDTKMAMTVDAKSVGLSVSGKGGTVTDSFNTKVKGKPADVRIDPRIFMDLFNKVKEDSVEMRMYHVPGAMSSFMFSSERDGGSLTLVGTYDKAK